MSETIDLRPCAFCGRNAQKILRSKIPDYHFFVKCGHCRAQTGEHASKKCAIYAWNYRDYLPYTPRHTDAAPGEAELGRELIAWAASPDRIIHEDYSYWCEICYGGVTSGPDVDHAADCFHLRAHALRDSE